MTANADRPERRLRTSENVIADIRRVGAASVSDPISVVPQRMIERLLMLKPVIELFY